MGRKSLPFLLEPEWRRSASVALKTAGKACSSLREWKWGKARQYQIEAAAKKVIGRTAPFEYTANAGWSSLVARWAHNPKVAGSNPAPATKAIIELRVISKNL